MNSKKSRLHKIAATATAFCVAFTQVAIAAPAFSVSTHEVSLPDTLRLDQAIQISVPSAVATIDKLIPGNSKTIFHIQTAHGQYQAEKQIETLLTHLEQNYGVETLLMEGASQPLDPEVINFFPEDRKSTLEAVDAFVRHSVVSGPEVFLLNSGKARGLGIEDEAAYEQNLQDFAAVISARDSSSQFLSDLEQGIERLAAIYLSSDARSFLKQVERKETGDVPFDIYLQQLQLAAEKHAGINLTDASWQLLWPMLTRVFTIEKLEKKIDAAAFKKQKEDFLKAVQSSLSREIYSEVEKLLNLKDLSAKLPDPETTVLFESLVRSLPDNFNYDRYSSVTAFCGMLMLKSQLNIETLADEIVRMEDKIAGKLAETKSAKDLVAVLKEYRLLKKLFALELLPSDFEKISADSIKPSQIIEKLKGINGNARTKEISFTNTNELNALYDKAVRFYEGARDRDTRMLRRIEERLDETGADKVAVVTGGFHSGPFAKYFEERGYSYVLMTPKLSTVDAQGRQNYLDVMQMWATAPKVSDTQVFEGGSLSASTIQPRPATPGILVRWASLVLGSNLFQLFQGRYMPRFATGAAIVSGVITPLALNAQAPAAPTAPAPIVAPAKIPVPAMTQADRNEKTRVFDLLKKRPTGNDEKKALMVQEQIQLIQNVSPAILLGNLSETLGLLTVIKDSTLRAALIGRLASFLNQYQLDPKQINEMMSAFLKILSDSREDISVRSSAGQAILQGISNIDFPSNVDGALVRSLNAVFSSSREDVSVRLSAVRILAFLVSNKNLTPVSISDFKTVVATAVDALRQNKDKSYPFMVSGVKILLEASLESSLFNTDERKKVSEHIQFAAQEVTRINLLQINERASVLSYPQSSAGQRVQVLDSLNDYVKLNPDAVVELSRIHDIALAYLLRMPDDKDKKYNPPYHPQRVSVLIIERVSKAEAVATLEKVLGAGLMPLEIQDEIKRAVLRLKSKPARSEARTVDLGGFPDRVSEASINAWANSIAKLAGSDAWIVSFEFVPKAGQPVIQGVAGVNNFASQVLAAAKAAGVIGDESSFEDLGRLLKANYQSMNFVASATTDARSESRLLQSYSSPEEFVRYMTEIRLPDFFAKYPDAKKKYHEYVAIFSKDKDRAKVLAAEIDKLVTEYNKVENQIDEYKENVPDFGYETLTQANVQKVAEEYSTAEVKAAEDLVLSGADVPEFFAAGAATRLGLGNMFLLSPQKFYLVFTVLKKMSADNDDERAVLERLQAREPKDLEALNAVSKQALEALEKMRAESPEFFDLPMGARILLMRKANVEALVRQRFAGQPEETISAEIEKAMSLQKMSILVNEDVAQEAVDYLKENNFFGFKSENIFFTVQPTFKGFGVDATSEIIKEVTRGELVNGHGYPTMQKFFPNQAFFVNSTGPATYLTRPLADEIYAQGGKVLSIVRINDMIHYDHGKSQAVGNAIDIPVLIAKVKEMGGFDALDNAEVGADLVLELLDNPTKQKGGSFPATPSLASRGFGIMPDTLAFDAKNDAETKAAVERIEGEIKSGMPYNRMSQSYKLAALVSARQTGELKGLSVYIRFREFDAGQPMAFAAETVTGDTTYFLKTRAVMQPGRNIRDFKDAKAIPSLFGIFASQNELFKSLGYARSGARDWDVLAYLESREVEEHPAAVNLAAVQVEEKREVRNPVSVFELSMVKSNGRVVVIDEPDDDKPQLPFWAQTDAGQLLWRTVLPGAPPQTRLEIAKRFGAFVQGEISDDGYQLQILARHAAVSDELDVMGLVAVAPSGELFPLVRFAASDIPLLQSQGVVAVENLSLKVRVPEQGRLVIEPVVGRSEQRTIEEPIVFQQVQRLSAQELPKKLVPAAGYNFFRVQLNGDNPALIQNLLRSLDSAILAEQSVLSPKDSRGRQLEAVRAELADISARILRVGDNKSLILAFNPQDRLVTIVTEGFDVNNSDVFVFNHPDAIPSTQILPKSGKYENLPARTALLAAYNEQGAVLTVQPSAFELARIRLLALLDRFISPEAVVAAYKQQAEDKVNYLGLVEVIEAVLGDEKLNLPTQIQVVGDASEAKVPDTEVASLLTGLRTELAELSQRSEARAVITSADYGQSFTAAFLRAFPERYESPAFQSGAFQDLELTQFEVKVESKAGNFSFVISENESFESIEARVQALADDKTLAVFGKTNGDLFRERHGFAETGQIVFSQSSKITAISIAPYFDRQPATPRSEARLTPEEIATIKVLLSEFTLGILTTEQIDQVKALKPTAEQIEQIYLEVFGVSLAEEVGDEVKTAVENFFSEEFLNQLAFSEAARQLPLQTAKSSAEFGWDVYTAAGIDQYSNDNTLALVADIEASLQQIGDTRPAKVVYVENDSEKSAVIDLLLAKLNSKDVPAQRKINKVDLLKAVKFVTAGDEWAAFVKANPSAVAWMNIANENAGMLGGNVFVFNFDRKEFSALTKQKYMAVGFLGLVLRRAMANTRGLDFAQAADLLKQALDQQQANVQRRPDGTFMVASVAQLLQAIVTAKYIEIMA